MPSFRIQTQTEKHLVPRPGDQSEDDWSCMGKDGEISPVRDVWTDIVGAQSGVTGPKGKLDTVLFQIPPCQWNFQLHDHPPIYPFQQNQIL